MKTLLPPQEKHPSVAARDSHSTLLTLKQYTAGLIRARGR